MLPESSTLLITGATGYIGRYLVARLVAEGVRPRCLVRSASESRLPIDNVELVVGDITEPSSLDAALQGIQQVVHLAAVVANLKETRTRNYKRINAEGTGNLVRAAYAAGVQHFVHMGGLNTVPSTPDSYMRTRYEGEQHVKTSGIPYTIFQPSILFGDNAAFFASIQQLIARSPIVPIPGKGTLRFQPVWVEDVVTCILKVLADGGRDETIPLGGPAYYTYDQLVAMLCAARGVKRLKLHMPVPLMKVPVAVLQTFLPRPSATTAVFEIFDDNKDNITELDSIPKRFGFAPRSLEDELTPRKP